MLDYLVKLVFVSFLVIDPMGTRDVWMVVREQTRFQRYSTCLPSGQVESTTRTQCLTACLQSNYCQTVTYQSAEKICSLFGDRMSDGQLIADADAETAFVTARNPCK